MFLIACQKAEDISGTLEACAYEANTEYDSVEEFLRDSDMPVFLLGNDMKGKNKAAPSDARSIADKAASSDAGYAAIDVRFTDTGVTVGEHYVSVSYDCRVGDDSFKADLTTYSFEDGKRMLQAILDNNAGVFSEEELSEKEIYYCPGTDVETYNCYAMVWEGRMFLINIEKGYDPYVELLMEQIE